MLLTGDAMQWHKLTLEFDGPLLDESPSTFTDFRLDVTFTHSATGEQITVPGYFAADGDAANSSATSGSVWKAHFNPPLTGEWTWDASFVTGDYIAVSSAAGASAGHFDGDSGSFNITPSDKSGDDLRSKGVLEYNGDQYLNFAGTDEVFLKSGVGSPENFLAYSGFDSTPGTHDYAPHIGDYNPGDPTWGNGEGAGIIGAVNYLAENDVNSAYMLLMNIGGDGRDVSPWTDQSLYNLRKSPGSPDLGERVQSFDVSKLDQWEVLFEHMQENGINLHLFLQETENDQMLNGGDLGAERMLYMREMVARFGHHNGIIWNLGEENSNTVGQITDHSEYLKDLDPYNHAVALHTYPSQLDRLEDYAGSDTLDVYSFQTGGQAATVDLDRFLGGAEDAGRPVAGFLDEPGHAEVGIAAEGDAGWVANHNSLREVLWKFYAEGGSGVEWYFGYTTAGGTAGDLNAEDFSLRESAYEWSASAREFFEKLPLERMEDGDNLTSGTQTWGLASDGEIYAYYLPNGGSPNLNLSGETGTYQVGWYNVIEGGDFLTGSVATVTGGGVRSLGVPPNTTGGEWAVMVWNTSYVFPEDAPAPIDPVIPEEPVVPEEPEEPVAPEEASFTLRIVNSDTDATITTLAPGDILNSSLVGNQNINIVADVTGTVGSVGFTFGDFSKVESVAPFSLFGDFDGDFNSATSAPFTSQGQYELTVELFSGANGVGKISETVTEFSVGSGEPVNPTPVSDANWIAVDGTVVMQAENGVPSTPSDTTNAYWQESTSIDGFTGDSFLHWTGPNFYNGATAGAGTLAYEFEVTESGNYKLGLFGSRPQNGLATDLNNDFWVRMDGGPWYKVFFTGPRETWNWGATFDINHIKSSAQYELDSGVHTLEISGRSADAFLDRIHLTHGNTLNTDATLPETLAPLVDDPAPVVPVNTNPVVIDSEFDVTEDGRIVIEVGDIATDPDGHTMEIEIVTAAANGTLVLSGGNLVYTPEANFSGADGAVVDIIDGEGGTTRVSLDFDVAPVNDAPDAQPDTRGTFTAGGDFTLGGLLGNDLDIDGDVLSIVDVTIVTQGMFETVSVDGTAIVGTLSSGAEGPGVLEYTVSDGNGGTDTTLVSITAAQPVEEPAPPPVDEPVEPPTEEPVEPPAEEPVEPPNDPVSGDAVSLMLADTSMEGVLFELGDRTIIHQSILDNTNLTVAAYVDEAQLPVQSAAMSFDGTFIRTENVEPYTLFGDVENDFWGALNVVEGEEHAVSMDFYSAELATGDYLGTESAVVMSGGQTMTGEAGVQDTFAFDAGDLGVATIMGFEAGDELAMLKGLSSQELLTSANKAGDDLVIYFGGGNRLVLDGLAAELAEDPDFFGF